MSSKPIATTRPPTLLGFAVADSVADGFIRRVTKGGPPISRDFQCRHDETYLSLFLCANSLATDEGLRDFQRRYRLPRSGDLPALWAIPRADLADAGLEPQLRRDDTIPYGELHYGTDCPDEDKADILARKAAQAGCLLPFAKNPARRS